MLLAVGEMFSLDLVLAMFAVAALAGMAAAAFGAGWGIQVIAFCVAALALLWLVRPSMVRRLHAGPDVKSGTAGLPGRHGYVEQPVSVAGGRVRIGGEVWSAAPTDESASIAVGERVEIVEIRGATAVVRPSRTEE